MPAYARSVEVLAASDRCRTEVRYVLYPLEASFFVEKRNGRYSGQTDMKLVSRKMTAKIPRMIASVPDICPAKYNTPIPTAKSTRMKRSELPMFFIITASGEE
jgi:hypothetical protein